MLPAPSLAVLIVLLSVLVGWLTGDGPIYGLLVGLVVVVALAIVSALSRRL